MPRIPIYEQQLVPNASPGSTRISPSTAGRGLQAIGQGLSDLAGVGERKEQVDFLIEKDRVETEGRIWSATASSKADLDMAEFLQKLQQEAKPGAPKFTPDFLKQFDEYTEGALKNAPSPFARQILQSQIAASRERYGRAALVFEAAERARYTGQQITEGVQNSSKLIYNNPSLFETEMGKWGSTIGGAAIDEAAKAKLRDGARKELAWSSVIGDIDRNPLAWEEKKPEPAAAPAPAGAPALAPAAPVNVSAADQKRLAAFKLTPQQETVLQSVAGGDAAKAAFLRTVLNIENRGFGQVKNDAVSSAGSMGPFQFTEATGKQYGLMTEADRKDFGKSAEAAARYYDDLNKRYNGNVLAMVAEYNGGMKAAQAVLAGKEPAAKETRDYVNMARYLMQPEQPAAPAAAAPAAAVAPEAAPVDRGPAWNMLTLDEQLKAREYARKKIDELRQNGSVTLRQETQNAEAMAKAGVVPTGTERTQAEFNAAFKDPQVASYEYSRYITARRTATEVASLSGQSTADLLTIIQTKPNPADPNFAVAAANQEIKARAAAGIVKARAEDPVAYSIQTGDFKLQVLNPQDPKAFGEELSRRAAALPVMAQKYGKASMLSKVEATSLARTLEVLPADQRVAQLETIRTALPDNAIYSQVINAIRQDSPVTALVGSIAAAGSKENARLIAVGEDLLNPTKGDKKGDGRGAFPMPQESLLRQAWVDAVGEAYRGYPDAEGTAYQGFKAYYAAVAAQKGMNDPKASPDERIVRDAIKASTGGIMRWKTDLFGNSTPSARIVLPYGMPEDVFRDKVSAEWLRVRDGLGYSKTGVGDIGLYNTGANGEYMVMSGTSWMPGPDGRPIILQISELTMPGLEPAQPEVPGAPVGANPPPPQTPAGSLSFGPPITYTPENYQEGRRRLRQELDRRRQAQQKGQQ